MHSIRFIIGGLIFPLLASGQVVFKTIVSRSLITVGESFQVQYVLEDVEKDDGFTTPSFKEFTIVSGPYAYIGSINNGSNKLKNIVFTLLATKPGRYTIPGATANVKGKLIKSDDVIIEVITKKEASARSSADKIPEAASEYFLQPGEDPYEKMNRNLFMKVMVDRRTCFVGQPVVATFKLYSRLESKSDIVKNPGFYGFAVYDIINLNDNSATSETINGKPFDVHTIRSVQLYPLQPGVFTIDPMQVVNKVEFSKSSVNKKTEQEIVEGVFDSHDAPARSNTISYENTISTGKIDIQVKPYPAAKRPPLFNGATGRFFIHTSLEKKELAKNEKGLLVITIDGKGNFTQLPAPSIQWPDGLENFDATVKDSLDKTQTPLKGSRVFSFPFVATKAGNYPIPAITFSFFDPDSNRYRTLSAEVPTVTITNEEIKWEPNRRHIVKTAEKKDRRSLWIYTGIAVVVLMIMVLEWRRPKKEVALTVTVPGKIEPAISIEQLLQPAQFSLIADDGRFYSLLQKTIWDHLATQLALSGSQMNKDDLYKAMLRKKIGEDQCNEILYVLRECEVAMFTSTDFRHDKQDLLDRAKKALEKMRDG